MRPMRRLRRFLKQKTDINRTVYYEKDYQMVVESAGGDSYHFLQYSGIYRTAQDAAIF